MAAEVVEATFSPRGPYDLRRMRRDGLWKAALPGGAEAVAWQRHDGAVTVRATDADSAERARFMLALDADHSEFHRRFGRDPLLGPSLRGLYGLRPLRTATVAHALLRAACGQLVSGSTARQVEGSILRLAGTRAPTAAELVRLSPAQLRSRGLATHRASALVRAPARRRPRAPARRLLVDRPAAAVPRTWLRAVVVRCRLPRRPGTVRPRQGRRPGTDQARLRPARPLGRGGRDRRLRRALRRVARPRHVLPDGGLLGRPRPRRRPGRLAAAAAARGPRRLTSRRASRPSPASSIHSRDGGGRAADRDSRRRQDRRGAVSGLLSSGWRSTDDIVATVTAAGARRRAGRAARDHRHALERRGRRRRRARRHLGQAAGHRGACSARSAAC